MKLKNIFMSALLFAGAFTAVAQEEETVTDFHPHWYVGGQFGAQYTLGEVSFGDLISPNAQVLVGYKFNPSFGLRLGVGFWQSKAGVNEELYGQAQKSFTWKQNYVAPTLDATLSLTNLIGGYNYNRLVDAGLLAGFGLNITSSNGAVDVAKQVSQPDTRISHLWDGTQCFLVGRFGAYADVRVAKRVSLGVEFNANITNDQ